MYDIIIPYILEQKAIENAINQGIEAYYNGETYFYINEEDSAYLSESDKEYIINEIIRRAH